MPPSRLFPFHLSKNIPGESRRDGGSAPKTGPAHNTVSRLARRRHTPMHEFDRLPAELRAWLHRAALPWSARSALRLWSDALRHSGGDRAAALARLDRAEARSLRREGRAIWGPGYPAP
jgi:hypothetical protein